MKISEIIEALKAYHPPVDEEHTCDVVKYGDPDQECTGIAVSCFPSVEVIRKAASLGANFLLIHEPLFWNDRDETDWLQNDPIFAEKKALLDETGMVVWRDHDHLHGGGPHDKGAPDMVFQGIMHELGWEDYLIGSANKPLLYEIPETDAETLGRELCEKLHLNGLRLVGDRNTKIRKVFFVEHISDRGPWERKKILRLMEEGIDAVIPFETVDWSMNAYIRDACALGHPMVMFNAGHFNMEELGTKYMLSYLSSLVGDTPVHHVFSGDAFDYL